MSDEEEHTDDSDPEGGDPPEDQADDQPEDEEQPDIEDDEMADLSGLADEIEDEAGGGADDGDDGDDSTPKASDEGELPSPDDPTGESWGDLYVGTLTTVSNAIIEEYGDGDTIDEDLARQQHLDEYFNDWMESRGKREDMPPEQALIISTSMFMLTVLGTKTDLVSDLLGEVDI